MADRPILFSGPMVQAILEGRKTQTRRVIRTERAPEPGRVWQPCLCREIDPSDTPCVMCHARFGPCPYGAPGDTLWVKETWRAVATHPSTDDLTDTEAVEIEYRADGRREWRDVTGETWGSWEIGEWCERWVGRTNGGWQPSIYMSRWASRLELRVESVRVERLQEISGHGAVAEGIERRHVTLDESVESVRQRFAELWDSINGERAPWASDPWVWVVGFSRVTP